MQETLNHAILHTCQHTDPQRQSETLKHDAIHHTCQQSDPQRQSETLKHDAIHHTCHKIINSKPSTCHERNFQPYNTSHLYKISMEIVGDLPGPEEILPNTIIPLFGILCKNVTNSAECHFCLETIENGETQTFATPCCKQTVHCSCFDRWAATSVTITGSTTVRCAYCRTVFPSEQLCFLCLKRKRNEAMAKTRCCRTSIHHQCINEVQTASTVPTDSNYILECGFCGCVWKKI